MIFRNSKLFQQEKKKEASTTASNDEKEKKKDERENRCKRQFSPTNGIVLSSVVLEKVDNVLTRLHFKKGNVSPFWE